MCAAYESLELQPELQKKEGLQCTAISFEKLLLWVKFTFIERKQPRNQKSTILSTINILCALVVLYIYNMINTRILVLSRFSRVRLFSILWTIATRLLCPWDSPGKNTGAGCHFLLQGIFLTQGSNLHLLHLLHWQADSLPLAPTDANSCYKWVPQLVLVHF